MKKQYQVIFFVIIFCIILNCSTEPEFKEQSLQNIEWQLTSFTFEGQKIKPPQGQFYTIEFNSDSTASGRNNCNDFSARYKSTDNSLVFESIFQTEKGCSGNTSIDRKFIEALRDVTQYEIIFQTKSLYLYSETDSMLIFQKKK